MSTRGAWASDCASSVQRCACPGGCGRRPAESHPTPCASCLGTSMDWPRRQRLGYTTTKAWQHGLRLCRPTLCAFRCALRHTGNALQPCRMPRAHCVYTYAVYGVAVCWQESKVSRKKRTLTKELAVVPGWYSFCKRLQLCHSLCVPVHRRRLTVRCLHTQGPSAQCGRATPASRRTCVSAPPA